MCKNSTPPDKFPLTDFVDADRTPARILTSFIGLLSVLGCLGIIATYIRVEKLRKATSRKILVYLSLADFLSSLTNLLGALVYFNNSSICHVQGAITSASGISSVFWSTCLAVYIYLAVARDNVVLAKELLPLFHLLSWGVPIAVAAVGLALEAFGSARFSATVGWCWIQNQPTYPETWPCSDARLLWRLVTLKGWECVSYALIPVMYISVKLSIRRATSPETQPILSRSLSTSMSAIDRKMSVMPLVYVLLRVWGTVRAFLDSTGGQQRVPQHLYSALIYLQAVGDNAQGMVNFILFVLCNKTVRNQLPSLAIICSCLPTLCNRRTQKHVIGQVQDDRVELLESDTIEVRAKPSPSGHGPRLLNASSTSHVKPSYSRDSSGPHQSHADTH